MKKLLLILTIIGTTSFYVPQKISWVAIGDSITYMNEHFEPTEYRITKGYLTLVTEKMPQLSYDNQGYSSLGATNIAHSIEKFPFKKADLYTIFLGTNDWAHSDLLGTLSDYINSTGDNTFFGAYRIIINKLRSLNKDARIVLITPMQRGDFVWLESKKVNTWGSYKEKNGQLLSQFAEAVNKISEYEHLDVVDLFNKSGMTLDKIVKYKRLKDPKTGVYKNYTYPDYIDIPFNPETDDHPYPADAIGLTYDGVHPSDEGYAVIASMLVKVLNKYY